MILNKIKEVKADGFMVFASLPDMGRVGGLVSSFLSQHLKTEQVAEITSSGKPWVSHSDGVVKSASDVYRISYDRGHKLLVFTGESQPQDPGELHRLCNMLLDYVQSIGKATRLYGAGGYLREQVTGSPRVCGVANRQELKKVLAKAGIDSVGNEITNITWFNGLILGLAAERGIDAIGLFGEIAETTVPKPLDRHYELILEDIQKNRAVEIRAGHRLAQSCDHSDDCPAKRLQADRQNDEDEAVRRRHFEQIDAVSRF
jgi:proteasome assembly chaperone (PAC2) family protein